MNYVDLEDDLQKDIEMLNDLVNKQAPTIMTPPRSVKGSVIDSSELLIENKSVLQGVDLEDDLQKDIEMLNDFVNKQAQTIMTPPRSVKGSVIDSSELLIDKNKSVLQESLTIDTFGNDSFFSESVLISAQALEEEALGCNPTPSKKMKRKSLITPSSSPTNNSTIFVFNQPSPDNVTRRSFDLDSEELIPNKSLDNFVSLKSSKLPVAIDQRAIPLASQPQTLPNSTACVNQSSSSKVEKPSTFNLTEKNFSKLQVNQVKPTYMAGTSIPSLKSNQIWQYASADRNRNVCPESSRSQKSTLSVQTKPFSGISHGIGITRLVNNPVNNKKPVNNQTHFVAPPEKVKSQDPFGDDDDDLLYATSAFASQFAQEKTVKSGVERMEENRQAAIRKREQKSGVKRMEENRQAAIRKREQKSGVEWMEENRQAAIRKQEQILMSHR